jgi:DNA-binding transcriptional ArsR family regulator
MDAVLQALSDSHRRTVLEALRHGPATVTELAALLPISRPGVSRHLRVLRDAGLVEVQRQSQFRRYSLRPEPLAALDGWLEDYRVLWQQRLDAPQAPLAPNDVPLRAARDA